MSTSLEYWSLAADAVKQLGGFTLSITRSFLDKKLIDLMWLRVSQLNGCAYCIDLHIHEALQAGESQTRLNLLAGWREAGSVFTPAKRAVFAWAESMTRLADSSIADGQARDRAYDEVRTHFSDAETVHLGLAIASIDAWNRIAIGFHNQFKPH